MKSRVARDAINSVIEDKLRKGSVPGKLTACTYGNSILEDLSEIIDRHLTLEEQLYLNERKSKNMGEIADAMINGALCASCGVYLEPDEKVYSIDNREPLGEMPEDGSEFGTPVICEDCT